MTLIVGTMSSGPLCPAITSEADAEHMFGKGSEMARLTASSLCAVGGHRSKSKACSVCNRRRAEVARGDWFAAEERRAR